jgi:hypothetical protein
MNDAIAHGVQIAGIFKKELCLFHPLGTGGKEKRLEAQKKLGTVIRELKHQVKDIPLSSLTLKGDLSGTIDRLAEDYDGIMLVLTSENIRKKIPALQQSLIPFLFIRECTREYLRYNRIILPVNTRKAIKSTALWASYFGRFNQSDIEILIAGEKNGEQQKQIRKNLKFTQELLGQLKVKAQLTQSDQNSFHLPAEALKKSMDEQFNLLIIPSSEQVSLIDMIVGLPESKIIKKAGNLPVLCINSMRDMYILCD